MESILGISILMEVNIKNIVDLLFGTDKRLPKDNQTDAKKK